MNFGFKTFTKNEKEIHSLVIAKINPFIRESEYYNNGITVSSYEVNPLNFSLEVFVDNEKTNKRVVFQMGGNSPILRVFAYLKDKEQPIADKEFEVMKKNISTSKRIEEIMNQITK